MNRREFIGGGLAFSAMASCQSLAAKQGGPVAKIGDIRALLLHLGHNMWGDYPSSEMTAEMVEKCKACRPDKTLRSRDDLWRECTDHAAAKGLNAVVIDLGEGLAYPSHPELAISGSWSADKMRNEVDRLNALGLEAIPKLNFSTTHNAWMGDYSHMVSSKPYYRFCEDVIRDAMEIFNRPRFFHIGFDEEYVEHQIKWSNRRRINVRLDEYWWADFLHVVRTVEREGARPWAWSDFGWDHEDYFTRCPKSVVQQNWYYDESWGGFDLAANKTDDHKRLEEFWKLEKAGFDQVPCGTNWVGWKRKAEKVGADDVIGKLVKLGREVISKDRLFGFMMAPWASCDTPEHAAFVKRGIDLLADAVRG